MADGTLLKPEFSAVRPLPDNVQLVSLRWWNASTVLVRLAHQFGIGEDAELSKPVDVDLATLFIDRSIEQIEERGLSATISRAEVLKKRIPWSVEGDANDLPQHNPSVESEGTKITLGPLQIKTFFL